MKDYKIAQKIIHWLMGILITIDLFIAQKFGREMTDFDRLDSRIDHATIGTSLLVLLVLRLLLLARNGKAALPDSMTPFQVQLAHWGHYALYGAMILLIGTGLVSAAHVTDPLVVFGGLELSWLSNQDEALFQFVRQFHNAMTWVMIALIVLHVLAALYHHYVLKDNTLGRMLKFWRSNS